MTTMLERAARAARDCGGYTEYGLVIPYSLAHDIARAVLMAVRGVDGHGIEMNWWSERIVDAILNEKDTTND